MNNNKKKNKNHKELPGMAGSLWVATTPKTNFPKLLKNIEADVAIIGAGIAGLSSAFLLKEAGLKVVVLEAEKIVKGTTGYTTAKVTSAHGMKYKSLVSNFGEKGAEIYASANQAAIEKIAEIIKKNNISCDFKRNPAFTYIGDKKNIAELRQEFKASKSAGLPVSWAQNFDLPFRVFAAIRFENQAQFHPRKYLLAIANKISGDGSYIFEETKVLGIKEGNPCLIETEKNTVKAKYVLIATRTPFIKDNFYSENLFPRQSYLIACHVKKILFEGMFYSPEEGAYSLRTHDSPEGQYLLVGGEGHAAGEGGDIKARYQKLETFAQDHFNIESIDYYWSAEDNRISDRIPYIGKFNQSSKNIFVSCGFGAWGMTTGTLSGMIIADLVLGKKNNWAQLYSALRLIKKEKINNMKKGFSIKNLLTGKPRKSKEDMIAEVSVDEGKIFKVGYGKVAIYKDEDGKAYTLSPVCKHMGCIVDWNSEDKTWDCPCHGSRYDKYGKVVHGPAKADLDKKEL